MTDHGTDHADHDPILSERVFAGQGRSRHRSRLPITTDHGMCKAAGQAITAPITPITKSDHAPLYRDRGARAHRMRTACASGQGWVTVEDRLIMPGESRPA